MENFKAFLKQEFLNRTEKNSSYSLRSFANFLNTNHATLSSILSGKRRITQKTIDNFSKPLNLSPEQIAMFSENKKNIKIDSLGNSDYFLIQQEAFAVISDWYYDAILELSRIKAFKLKPETIASSIGITKLKAKLALETLVNLELLFKNKSGEYELQHLDSTNLLDSEFTSAANRKYQKSVLNKSIESIESTSRKYRDHTSTTMAIRIEDLPKAKKIIEKFRKNMCTFLQKNKGPLNEVYQLQVSFFPLSQNFTKNKETKR